MAKTAVVNKRGRRRRRRNPTASTSNRRRRRRKNYGAAATINPRRRRRRSYGMARRRPSGRRRRNPVSPYASSGYYRRANPSFDVMNDVTEIMPAATGGIWAARWALRQAGAFEADAKSGVLEPGIKHALAIYLAATMGSSLIGSVLGAEKANIAKIAALGYGGDLFLRTRFMKDSKFVQDNLSLQGMGTEGDGMVDDNGYYVPDGMNGFQEQSVLGSTMVDAFGNSYVSTPQGWQLSGPEDLVVDDAGNVYQLSGGGARLAGFSQQSPLGAVRPSSDSSFGYSRG